MDDVAHLEAETRLHRHFIHEDQQRAHKELKVVTRLVRVVEAKEAAMAEKEKVMEHDHKGARHALVEVDRACKALQARAIKLGR